LPEQPGQNRVTRSKLKIQAGHRTRSENYSIANHISKQNIYISN